jgi:hypothetical protein
MPIFVAMAMRLNRVAQTPCGSTGCTVAPSLAEAAERLTCVFGDREDGHEMMRNLERVPDKLVREAAAELEMVSAEEVGKRLAAQHLKHQGILGVMEVDRAKVREELEVEQAKVKTLRESLTEADQLNESLRSERDALKARLIIPSEELS